jgi:hypothetical protein
MEKPYDLNSLIEKLKGRGLDMAEEGAKAVIEESLAWFEASAKLSATPFDDVALVVVPQLKKAALELADKIDGQVG